ncbi:small ribosomal subunit protein mS40 isoform X2 [Ciconia boyciana]|uniref:small ribosomal subunit protein mS40 isoform X2 n=1 Tax=Ciconia boyciana TaxID=52775 RepID=UPI003BA19E45
MAAPRPHPPPLRRAGRGLRLRGPPARWRWPWGWRCCGRRPGACGDRDGGCGLGPPPGCAAPRQHPRPPPAPTRSGPGRTWRAKRRGKPVGNPCPICRDRHLHVDFRNVKLLDQFICPHSGNILHPTHTGVCMKQHKLLTKAIAQARDHGLLWLQVPYVPVPRDDFSNRHPAVGKTPPAPALAPGRHWYPWYERQPPPAAAIARVRRLYKDYLKKEEAPPAAGTPPDASPAPCAEHRGE